MGVNLSWLAPIFFVPLLFPREWGHNQEDPMSVHKYKPKSTPRSLEQSLDRTAEHCKKSVRETKETIQRSRDLITDSLAVIEHARELRRKHA